MRLKGILKTSENQRHWVLSYENTGENGDLGPPCMCCVAHTPFPKWLLLVECETCGTELLIEWELACKTSVHFQGFKILFYLDHSSFSLGIRKLFLSAKQR